MCKGFYLFYVNGFTNELYFFIRISSMQKQSMLTFSSRRTAAVLVMKIASTGPFFYRQYSSSTAVCIAIDLFPTGSPKRVDFTRKLEAFQISGDASRSARSKSMTRSVPANTGPNHQIKRLDSKEIVCAHCKYIAGWYWIPTKIPIRNKHGETMIQKP